MGWKDFQKKKKEKKKKAVGLVVGCFLGFFFF